LEGFWRNWCSVNDFWRCFMSKRIEAVERRLDDIEKAIAVLQALILSDDGYGENRQVTTPVGAVSGEETDGKEDTGGGETRPVAEADAREAIGRSGRKAAGRAAETPGLVHNSLGDPYSIKLVYPTFYRSLDVGIPYCTVSFPSGKERLAKQIQEGTLFFIYVTSPVRRVIGLAQAMGPAEYRGDVTPSRPWVVPMEWIIGPKADGVSFAEIGLEVRGRPGDSVYAIPVDAAVRLMEALRLLCDLDEAGVARLRSRFGLDAS
jgi:hypothetical protein